MRYQIRPELKKGSCDGCIAKGDFNLCSHLTKGKYSCFHNDIIFVENKGEGTLTETKQRIKNIEAELAELKKLAKKEGKKKDWTLSISLMENKERKLMMNGQNIVNLYMASDRPHNVNNYDKPSCMYLYGHTGKWTDELGREIEGHLTFTPNK